MFQQIKRSLFMVIIFTVLCGIIYPGLLTVIGQSLFPWQANGSLIMYDGKVIGSTLIGQEFVEEKYFWGRPSATVDYQYNALASSGSNLSTTNPKLYEEVKQRIELLHKMHVDKNNHALVPADLVYTSASGLDPEISLHAAMYQVARIAKVRKVDASVVEALLNKYAHNDSLPIFNINRVNVLQLNLALDEAFTSQKLKEK